MEKLTRRQVLEAGAAGVAALGAGAPAAGQGPAAPEKTVVLTFDDAVKSHRTFVGPLLKELGFGATFFVTHRWMEDRANFMTWAEIAKLHGMGFEIGNHSWTHAGFNTPRAAARLGGELALVEGELKKVGVPKPVSFAWCANAFGPEAVARLREAGYRFARRGMQPEIPYGQREVGPAFDRLRHHPLLIPTTGDAYPDWTLEHFKRVVNSARPGQVVVLQFHGVPDVAHPWVHTPPERFREYMATLKEGGFRGIALRDLEPLVPREQPADPALKLRHPRPAGDRLPHPPEVEQTRADLPFWLPNMLVRHRYTPAEAASVCGFSEAELERRVGELGKLEAPPGQVIPYPGGRHPRAGFLDGAVDPQRGTKVSLFTPWDPHSYVVLDLPEAVFSNLGLTFLAHTHIPTVWDEQNVAIENVDWQRREGGVLEREQALPNGIGIGSRVTPEADGARLEMWLRNSTGRPLAGLRTQVCAMLKGAAGFDRQTNENKRFQAPIALAGAPGDRWILLAFERTGRAWGNPPVPCLHADPVFPDCPAGETVRVRGRLRFHQGGGIERVVDELNREVGRGAP